MLTVIAKRTLTFAVPAVVLVATWFLVPYVAGLTPVRQELALFAPYLITALGLFLSFHFHRGRSFMALLILILFYWSSRTCFSGEQIQPGDNKVFQAFVLLVPPNLLLLAFMRERGIFTFAGRLRFIFLAVQGAAVMWFFNRHFAVIQPYIASNYIGLPPFNSLLVPQMAMVTGALCFAAIVVLALRRQTPIESGILGALIAFFIACNWLTNRDIHIAYCTAGALIINLSVLRDSYNMAFRDDLTGIPSRRSLNESINGLGRLYAIAMLDVDHFKRFNDTYGHDVGDQVLKAVASKMLEVGGGGRAFRYGGEEFTIIFPGRRVADILPHLEKLRINIAEYRLVLRSEERPKQNRQGKSQRGKSSGRGEGARVSVTVSIGVAECSDKLKTAAEVMKAADKALYKAKNKGRNQVCS